MTGAREALSYAAQGFPVFPWMGRGASKAPLTRNGYRDATRDGAQIEEWWRRWPTARIGGATGHRSVVLDVDVKRQQANGFDTLAALGRTLPSFERK